MVVEKIVVASLSRANQRAESTGPQKYGTKFNGEGAVVQHVSRKA